MNMFAKLKRAVSKPSDNSIENNREPQTDNPYLNARRAWNGHVAGMMSAVQIWQMVGVSGLLIGLSAVGGMIYLGSQATFIPLVFQQDTSGNTISVTRADRVPEAKIDDYRTTAARFIENMRVVTADADLQSKAIWQAYASLSANDPATMKANAYLNGKDAVSPFERAAHETVSIEVRSVLQQSKSSWQVDWMETVRHRDGSLKEPSYLMRAMVTLYQNEPTRDTTNMEALRNPHFIFVRDFNWSKQIQPRS